MARQVSYGWEENKLLSGKGFFISTVFSVANAASLDILFVTGANSVNVSSAFSLMGDADIEVYEDTIVTANGSALTTFNANRTSGNTTEVQLFEGPTITNDGTLLSDASYVGGTKNQAIGFDVGDGSGLILKPSSNYLLRIVNDSGALRDYTVTLDWFEIEG